MFKAFSQLISEMSKSFLNALLNFIWLMLPLGFHVLFVQLRERIDTLPALTTYVSPDSTWMAVYNGVVLVNTNPGAVRKRLAEARAWFVAHTYLWIALAILTALSLLAVIAVHFVK